MRTENYTYIDENGDVRQVVVKDYGACSGMGIQEKKNIIRKKLAMLHSGPVRSLKLVKYTDIVEIKHIN